MLELEITEFKSKPHGYFGVSYHGDWVLAYSHYVDETAQDRKCRWYVQFVISRLSMGNLWETSWHYNSPLMTEDDAMDLNGQLRYGDLLWCGFDKQIRLHRKNGETLTISYPWKPVQLVAIWECGRVCWAISDTEDVLHLLDSELQELICLNLSDAPGKNHGHVDKEDGAEKENRRFFWVHFNGGIVIFVGELYGVAYQIENNKFGEWNLHPKKKLSDGLLFSDSHYLASFFDVGFMTIWIWNRDQATFVGSDYSQRAFAPYLYRYPQFNRDFVCVDDECILIEGITEQASIKFPRQKTYVDQFEQGTLWMVYRGVERVLRIRLVEKTPSLLKLATKAYAKTCMDLICCDSWKTIFYDAVENLATGMNARQTTRSSANQEIGYFTQFARGGT